MRLLSKFKQLDHNKKFIVFSVFFLSGIFGLWLTIRIQFHVEEGQTRIPSLGIPIKVEPRKEESLVLLNDPAIKRNWGMMGTGGTADIRAQKAWNITQGSRDIIVAIIDTGADVNHADLKSNIWKNPGESGLDSKGNSKATNKIDDDRNGYVDDVHGWNFVGNNHNLVDNHGHGTHIAGLVGAEGGNGIGISGVSPKVSLMVLKYYDPNSRGTDNLRNTIRAIDYAVQNGAKIINYSGGGLDYSQLEYEAVKRAREKGILFIAAAGNERSNSDQNHYYPANYPLDNIISVTAVNQKAQVLSSSNYGVRSVHIAAPGENIYSTLPNGQYGLMTGTSQATAFVTGVAALIEANNTDFKYDMVKRQILGTADITLSIMAKTQTSGILNSWAALAIQPAIPASGIISHSPVPLDLQQLQQANNQQSTISDRTPSITRQISNINLLLNNLNKPSAANNNL